MDNRLPARSHRRLATPLLLLSLATSCLDADSDDSDDTPTAATTTDVVVTPKTVGGTAGTFAVTDQGEATYSIPIEVPPGRNGLEPHLALEYRSNGRDGIAGVGWSLSGLSRITPCPRTKAQDGDVAPVTLTSKDRLCLDGVRMVAVAGAYGAAGTEYRLERDDFTKIVETSSPCTPCADTFIAYRKDGRIEYYDQTLVIAGAAMRWDVGEIEDRFGNEIDVAYTYDDNHVPSKISYTPGVKAAGDLQKQIAPIYTGAFTRSVTFDYVTRTDVQQGYVAGYDYGTNQLLTAIHTFGPAPTTNGPIRNYTLTYTPDPVSGSNLLTAVQACDPTGNCKPATTFSYQADDTHFDVAAQSIPLLPSTSLSNEEQWLWMLHTGDLDGDGRDDVLYRKPEQSSSGWVGHWYFRLSTGTGFGPETDAGLPLTPYGGYGSGGGGQLVDWNLDGKLDFTEWLYDPSTQTGQSYFFVNTGHGFTPASLPDAVNQFHGTPPVDAEPLAQIADLESKGYPNILEPAFPKSGDSTSAVWGLRENDHGNLGVAYSVAAGATSLGAPAYLSDLDGDGRPELITTGSNGWTSYDFTSPLAPTAGNISSITNVGDLRRVFADVNGDGLPDVYLYGLTPGSEIDTRWNSWLELRINTGANNFVLAAQFVIPNAFMMSPSRVNGIGIDNGVRIMDYDSDGRSDMMLVDSGINGARQYVSVLRSRAGLSGFDSNGVEIQPELVTTTIPVGDPLGAMGWKLAKTLDANGDGLTDLVELRGTNLYLYTRRGNTPLLLAHIVDGNGAHTDITYKPMSDPSVYTPATTCGGGLTFCMRTGRELVATESQSTSAPSPAAVRSSTHRYEDGRVDLSGRGFVGFAKHVVTDDQRGSTTTYQFANAGVVVVAPGGGGAVEYPGANTPYAITTTVKLAAGTFTSTRTIGYASVFTNTAAALDGGRPIFFYPHTVQEVTTDADGATTTTNMTYGVDDYGSINSEHLATAHHDELVSITYENHPDTWLIGLPSRRTWVSTVPGTSSAQRVEAWTYEPRTGALATEVREPDAQDSTYVQTTYSYDGTGVETQATAKDRLGVTRTGQRVYDLPDHVFPVQLVDGLGRVTRLTYHGGLGVVTSVTDANGLVTKTTPDGFGRPTFIDLPDASDISISYESSSYGAQQVKVSQLGHAASATHYDSFLRPVLEQSTAYDGSQAFVSTTYDKLGNPASRTRPYFTGDVIRSDMAVYDALDRPLRVTHYDGSFETFQPSLTQPCTVDARGHRACQTLDELGLATASIDYDDAGAAHATTFAYGPFEQRTRTTDELGNVTTVGYDTIGRRISFDDPDAAPQTMGYNGVDELIWTEDGLGRITSIQRDGLGRVQSRSTPEGLEQLAWDPVGALGKLASTTAATGTVTSFAYDALDRLTQTTVKIPSGTTFTVGQGYDAYSRVQELDFPLVGITQVKALYDYTSAGWLADVKSPAGLVYWQANTRNATGAPTKETLGNGVVTTKTYWSGTGPVQTITSTSATGVLLQQLGYTYDGKLDVTRRTNGVDGTTETFGYDYLDRLTSWSSTDGHNQAFHYDVLGNLTGIDVLGGPGTSQVFPIASASVGPHQLASSAGYTYDLEGEQTGAPGRTVQFTSFELPSSITHSGRTTTFTYDADHARVIKSDSAGNQTIYVGGVFESRTTKFPTVTSTAILTIPGEDGPVAQLVMTPNKGAPATLVETDYFLADHLGSIDAVTDAAGSSKGKGRFLPFGARTSAYVTNVHEGFTGQYEEPDLGLIDFRGRIYDPAIGRFLSRDPILHDADFSQSFNPYSYVMNNPLSHRDPSGLEECDPPEPPRPMTPDTPPPPGAPGPGPGGGGGTGPVGPPPTSPTIPTPPPPAPVPAGDGSATKLRDNSGTQATPWGGRALFGTSPWEGEAPWLGPGPEEKTFAAVAAGPVLFLRSIITAANNVFEKKQQRYPWEDVTRTLDEGGPSWLEYQIYRRLGYFPRGIVIGRGSDLWDDNGKAKVGRGEWVLSWPGAWAPEVPPVEANLGFFRPIVEAYERSGFAIRDASPGDTGGKVLNGERALLRGRGWTFDAITNKWSRPAPIGGDW